MGASLATKRTEHSARLEQLAGTLTEEKLVTGPRAYAHHQEVVITELELSKDCFL